MEKGLHEELAELDGYRTVLAAQYEQPTNNDPRIRASAAAQSERLELYPDFRRDLLAACRNNPSELDHTLFNKVMRELHFAGIRIGEINPSSHIDYPVHIGGDNFTTPAAWHSIFDIIYDQGYPASGLGLSTAHSTALGIRQPHDLFKQFILGINSSNVSSNVISRRYPIKAIRQLYGAQGLLPAEVDVVEFGSSQNMIGKGLSLDEKRGQAASPIKVVGALNGELSDRKLKDLQARMDTLLMGRFALRHYIGIDSENPEDPMQMERTKAYSFYVSEWLTDVSGREEYELLEAASPVNVGFHQADLTTLDIKSLLVDYPGFQPQLSVLSATAYLLDPSQQPAVLQKVTDIVEGQNGVAIIGDAIEDNPYAGKGMHGMTFTGDFRKPYSYSIRVGNSTEGYWEAMRARTGRGKEVLLSELFIKQLVELQIEGL